MLQQKVLSLYGDKNQDYSEKMSMRKITTKGKMLIKRRAEAESSTVIKELKGYLQKKSPSFFRGWQVSGALKQKIKMKNRQLFKNTGYIFFELGCRSC